MRRWVLILLLAAAPLAAQIVLGAGGSASGGLTPQGAISAGDCAKWASGTALADAGAPCGSGSVSLPVVQPSSYGAVGNGAYYFDGAITPSTNIAVGDSATPATPAVATAAANAVVDYAFGTNNSWATAPSTGTSRIAQTYPGAGYYVLTVRDESFASAASVPSVGGTVSSSNYWNAGGLVVPASGSSAPAVVGTPQSAQTSSGNTTVNVPSGAASGDVLVAFAEHYGSSLTWPSGWTVLQDVADANGDRLATAYLTLTGSAPASYTWTGSGSIGIIAYSGAGTPYALSTLSSSTANFGTGVANDLVCTAGTGTSSVEQCGRIAGQISSTEVFVSYVSQISPSNIPFGFATDDSAAFTTMLTTAPCSTTGCTVMLAPHGYGLDASYKLPPNVSIEFQGAGEGIPNTRNSFINGNTAPDANIGTRLMFLTTSLSSAAITIGGTAGVPNTTAFDRLSDLSVLAGAGVNRDGGGANGVNITAWQSAALNRVMVANFSGACVYSDGITNGSTNEYIESIDFNQLYTTYCGGAGRQIGSSLNISNLETIWDVGGVSEENGGPGMQIEGNIQGYLNANNVIQWNNQASPSGKAELEIDGTAIKGCLIEANYFEVDAGDTYAITPNKTNCTTINNYIAGNTSQYAEHVGVGTSSPGAELTVNGNALTQPYVVPYATSPAFDLSASNVEQFACTTAGAALTPAFSNLIAGQVFTVIFVQNGTTACTWTWPSTIHGGGTVTTALNGVSTQQFVVSNNGTDAYALNPIQNATGGTP